MKTKTLFGLSTGEKNVLSAGLLFTAVTLAAVLLVEPAVKEYRATLLDIAVCRKETVRIKKNDKEKGAKPLTADKANNYMFNYIEGFTEKSEVENKSFRSSGVQITKGTANFQLKLESNAVTFLKLLFVAENTVPFVSINNFRISSMGGGTYKGLRQLDTVVAVSISTKRLGAKILYPDLSKFITLKRDPFAPAALFEKASPGIQKTVVSESWTLTAAMSEEEQHVLFFKEEGNGKGYKIMLKKKGGIMLFWSGSEVNIKTEKENLLWSVGETKAASKIPELILKMLRNGEVSIQTSEKASDFVTEKAEKTLEQESVSSSEDSVIEGSRRIGSTNRSRRLRR
ncbi:MAG: hypothetical protein NTX32_07510 [Candidatus Firestonebacteria bacterium]|nr:hypothetical protein [Candidatus Firestonebacteria bacterium]